MKINSLLILSPFLLVCCKINIAGNAAAISNQADTLGVKTLTIKYEVKVGLDDREVFEDGIMPWISLDNPAKQIDSLINADELVLAYPKVTLLIDYPLTKPAVFEISTTSKGFTRKELIMAISKKYHEIYEEEEKTTQTGIVPVDQRKGVINRNETNGKYGICCHDLSDLDLGSIEVYQKDDGKIYLELDVES